MKDRIQQLMDKVNMTAAEFADAIGVQRSSVSHVLNGRNNPSSTFLQKIVSRFPNVDSRWLLLGEGEEPKPFVNSLFESKPEELRSKAMENPKIQVPLPQSEEPDSFADNLIQMIEPQTPETSSIQAEKKRHRRISRIVIFYDDKTFSEYFPGE